VANDGVVYVGGDFDHISGKAISHIAKWHKDSWSALELLE